MFAFENQITGLHGLIFKTINLQVISSNHNNLISDLRLLSE